MNKTISIETERLILRQFSTDDANDMFEWLSSDNVTKHLTFPTYKNIEDVYDRLDYLLDKYKNDDDFYNWCIELKEENKAIGDISCVNINYNINCARIGYCLNEKYWSQGFMSEALEAIINYLLFNQNFNRIESSHSICNPSSGKVMQKCNMQKEGVLRSAAKSNFGITDSVVYSILKSDLK